MSHLFTYNILEKAKEIPFTKKGENQLTDNSVVFLAYNNA